MEDECGISSDRVLLKRIIGGNQAKFGQFPWQAYLKITGYQCGGVLGKSNIGFGNVYSRFLLVSRRFVATAAHCILKARIKDIQVYLGELDTQNGGKVLEFAPEERHKVRYQLF